MSLEDEVDVMRRIPLFANVDPAKLKLLAFTSERVTFAASQELFHQGDPADAAYVVIAGAADVLVDADDGEITVARLERNDIIGDIAIICDVPRTATVRATDDLVAVKIVKEQFLDLIREFPEISLGIMRVLAERLAATTADLSETRGRLQELGG